MITYTLLIKSLIGSRNTSFFEHRFAFKLIGSHSKYTKPHLFTFSSALKMKKRAYDSFDVSDSSEDETTSQSGSALFNEPLFDFNFTPVGPRRGCRNVAERTQYRAELQQLRAPTNDDNIGESLAGALEKAVAEQLMEQQRPDGDIVNLAVAAVGFQHVFGSVNFRVGELLDNGPRFDMFLQRLARSLNSN